MKPLFSVVIFLVTLAFHAQASAALPYCRTLVSGWNRSGELIFAEVPVQNFKAFQHGDLRIRYILSVKGGQLNIENNNEIAAHTSDSAREYRAHANGDLTHGGILTLDLNMNGSKTEQNVCFGAVESVLISCSYRPKKVDTYFKRFLKEPTIKHSLPECP